MDTHGGRQLATTFDQAARNRIRQAVLAYMQANDIGTPTMAARITAANPRLPEVSFKTLQRFIEGRMRTNDGFVRTCEAFIATLPVADPVGETGRGLVALYGKGGTDAAGSYRCLEPEWRSLLDAAPDDGFCRVTQARVVPHQFFDGAMLDHAGTQIALLRDRLTMEPLQYTLTAAQDRMEGSCVYRRAASAVRFERLKS